MKFIKDYALHNSHDVAIDFDVTKKKEGSMILTQALIYVFIVVAVLAVFVIPVILGLPVAIAAVAGIALAVVVFQICYHGTRTICNYDLKYSIFTTNVTMDKKPETVISFEVVKDRKKKDEDKRNVVFERAVKKADLFAPYTEKYMDKLEGANVIDFRSSVKKIDDVYFGLYTEEDGSKTAIIFEAVNKVVEKLAYYNKEATVVEKLSR